MALRRGGGPEPDAGRAAPDDSSDVPDDSISRDRPDPTGDDDTGTDTGSGVDTDGDGRGDSSVTRDRDDDDDDPNNRETVGSVTRERDDPTAADDTGTDTGTGVGAGGGSSVTRDRGSAGATPDETAERMDSQTPDPKGLESENRVPDSSITRTRPNPTGEDDMAPQGGDVRLLIEEQRRAPEGGDVRLRAESRDRRGVQGGDVRLRETADDDRRPVNQDRVTELVARFERETGVDVPGEGRVTEPTRRGEQFGDFEGGVLGRIDREASALATGAQETLTDAYARQDQQPAPGPSLAGPVMLSPSRLFTGTSGDAAEGAAQGAASITAGAPQTVVEATEFGVGAARGEFDSGDVQQAAVNRVVQTGEGAATNPTQFAGSIAGSTVASVGAIGTAQRFAGPRAGRAVSTVIQPGEEAAAAAARAGVVSARTASRVPGVSEAQATARGTSASRSTKTTRRLRQGVRDARARVSEATARAPDVQVTRDASSGPVDVDPLLGQQVRSAVSDRTPSRPTTPGDGLRVEAARLRRGVSEARRDARAEVRRRASAIAPDRDSLSGDASVPTALQNPTGTARQAAARTQRTLSEGVRDVQAETRRRASALVAETNSPRPSLSVGDGLRVEAARLRRSVSEARRDVRAEGRRRVSDLRESVTSRPNIDAPALGGAADTTTADVFGRPARTRRAVADLEASASDAGQTVRDVPGQLRARVAGATPSRPSGSVSFDGAADTTTADVFGRPRQTQATAERVSSGLQRAGDRIRSLGDDSVTTPSLPRPGELTLRIGPARPARVDVGDVDGTDIGYDLDADVPDEFRPGENLVGGDAPTAGTGGETSIGGTADVGGGQQVRFRGGRRGGEVDTGPLASDSRADRGPARVFRRGEPQTPDAPSETPAVTEPELTSVGTSIDVGGSFGADAVGRPALSTDVDTDVSGEIEPGRDTRLEPGREFDFGRETEVDTPRRTETTTDIEEPQEIRREINPETPTEPRPERRRFDGLQPDPREEAAAIDGGGDEGRFEFSTRGLL